MNAAFAVRIGIITHDNLAENADCRRGKATSGDIDILFGPPANEEEVILLSSLNINKCWQITVLPDLVAYLSDIGFLTDHLTYHIVAFTSLLIPLQPT